MPRSLLWPSLARHLISPARRGPPRAAAPAAWRSGCSLPTCRPV